MACHHHYCFIDINTFMSCMKLQMLRLGLFDDVCVLDLIYCGRVLCDDDSLASCGISAGSTVLALKRTLQPETSATGMS